VEILEQIHLENPKKFHLNERKIRIDSPNVIITGGQKCGKSSLILNKLFEYKKEEYLYIDFADIRTPKNITFEQCIIFCKQKNIKILAIENSDFPPATIDGLELIFSSKKPIFAKNFDGITVLPLDFEEFISFSQKQLDEPSHIFSLFLKDGNLPQKVGRQEFNKLHITQQAINGFLQNTAKQIIFTYLCQNGGLKLTFLQMYNGLRNNVKISKDSLYKFSFEIEEEGMVYFVEKFGQQNGAKKIYLYDFSMISAVTYKKEPLRVFENMVFLELAKYNQEIYYNDGIDFLIPEDSRAIIARAFATKEYTLSKLPTIIKQLKHFEIKILEIVTMGMEFIFEYDDILVEALPFWTWALKD